MSIAIPGLYNVQFEGVPSIQVRADNAERAEIIAFDRLINDHKLSPRGRGVVSQPQIALPY